MTILILFAASFFTIILYSNAATSKTTANSTALSDIIFSSPARSSAPTCTAGEAPYCPGQIRNAYDFGPILSHYTGTGQTIVLVDACLTESNSSFTSDLSTFTKEFGLSSVTLKLDEPFGHPTASTCPTALANNWAGETALDVEWAHAVAPGAKIVDVMANSQANLIRALTYAINNKLGNQISNSWSEDDVPKSSCPSGALCTDYASPCSGYITELNTAASDGITVLASAWDHSAWGYSTGVPNQFPADCEGVTAVGGTSLTLTSGNAYSSESAWGDGSAGTSNEGTGGGFVTGVAEPTYESSVYIVQPSGISSPTLGKPDVSAVADPETGVWIYSSPNGGWLQVGGTSLSSPLWAGFMADVNDWRLVGWDYGPVGWLNAFLYEFVYGAEGTAPYYYQGLSFHDVTTGSNGWPAGTGWDPDTGLGSFKAYDLAWILATSPAA
jgi:subtilase family serine protease